MKKYIILILFVSTSVLANLHLAPADFNTQTGQAIFVDFKSAQYDVLYDVIRKKTNVKSRITFFSDKEGSPIFDLIPDPEDVMLDGKAVVVSEVLAPNGSKLRVINELIKPGIHILEMKNLLKRNVRYNLLKRTVSSAFWLRDLKYRMFLEQYFPSNFEFDQYQMTFNVTFSGIKKAKQEFFTNGEVKKVSPNSYQIIFPDYFTVSCPYFHTTPKGQKKRIDFNYSSIDGRSLPITVYTSWWSNPLKFKQEAIKILKELENDYGPWGHKGLVAYETFPGTGGMEHSGATQTSLGALDHEMLHSYFARGVMPANGNAGWIDEAIASWRDFGYQRKPLPEFTGSNLGKGSAYQRNTDSRAYSIGREFMAYLDFRLQDIGGLKAFLRGYFQTYKHTVITQEHFKNNLEFFSGLDLTLAFDTYIWGENTDEKKSHKKKNPIHKPLTENQLELIL
jgi:hypothetical protein